MYFNTINASLSLTLFLYGTNLQEVNSLTKKLYLISTALINFSSPTLLLGLVIKYIFVDNFVAYRAAIYSANLTLFVDISTLFFVSNA